MNIDVKMGNVYLSEMCGPRVFTRGDRGATCHGRDGEKKFLIYSVRVGFGSERYLAVRAGKTVNKVTRGSGGRGQIYTGVGRGAKFYGDEKKTEKFTIDIALTYIEVVNSYWFLFFNL